MTRNSTEELIRKWAPRYHQSDRKGKKNILDEFVALTSYHRKSAIRALRRRPNVRRHRGRPRTYTNEVKAASIELWKLSDKICSKRLAPFLPELMDVLEREGERRCGKKVVPGGVPILAGGLLRSSRKRRYNERFLLLRNRP